MKKSDIVGNAGVPRICYMARDKHCEGDYNVSIAWITGKFKDTWEMQEKNGSARRIEYDQQKQSEIVEEILNQMKMAIQHGVEFIILPEYSVSAEALNRIQLALKQWKLQNEVDNSRLIAVFAGSTWHADDDNVQHILDVWGRELGQYYKFSPFTKKSNTKGVYTICEALEHPGRVCTLLGVDNVGLILPAICRDVIDKTYTERLVKNFFPTFVVVSAYSKSVNSFKPHLRGYAETHFANSVLCNGCDAIHVNSRTIGCVVTVDKNKTIACGRCQPVEKTKECQKCRNVCWYLIRFNFNPNMVGNGEKTQIIPMNLETTIDIRKRMR